MSKVKYTPARISKALVQAVGLVLMLVSLGVLHGRALLWANIAIAVLTAVVHFLTPMEPMPGAVVVHFGPGGGGGGVFYGGGGGGQPPPVAPNDGPPEVPPGPVVPIP